MDPEAFIIQLITDCMIAAFTGTVLCSRQKCGMADHLGPFYRALVVWLEIVRSYHNQFH